MDLLPGYVVNLKAVRPAPYGWFLTDGSKNILLHESGIVGNIAEGETVRVFLYQDRQGRIAATQKIPEVRVGSFGWCRVADRNDQLGVFVDIGIGRDILLHKGDLPPLREVWPQKGDKLYCTLKNDRFGNLLARLATEEEMKPLFRQAGRSIFNQTVKGIVYRTIKAGSFIITEEKYRAFLHESQRFAEPRLGEAIEGRVIGVKDDGTINISMLKRVYESISDHAETVYRYLVERGGVMPYTDKSAPEDIKKRFA